MKTNIVLASSSRYRAELLSRLAIPFEIWRPEIDESSLTGETPRDTALRLSIAKARAGATLHPNSLIIGSDQVADLAGVAIGKPGTRERAREQLEQMRGESLVFHSGLALYNTETGSMQSCVVPTTVEFREYSDREIESYLDREQALDCAGSAKSEGLGIALIAAVRSEDSTALIGLPLIALCDMLRAENIFPLS